MPESNVKENGSSFAGNMSAIFASVLTGSILDGFEINYSFFINSFDIVPILIRFIIILILFYPFNKFFRWLYSASPKNKKYNVLEAIELTRTSNRKIQLAVFTPFNILASYIFPLKRALSE